MYPPSLANDPTMTVTISSAATSCPRVNWPVITNQPPIPNKTALATAWIANANRICRMSTPKCFFRVDRYSVTI